MEKSIKTPPYTCKAQQLLSWNIDKSEEALNPKIRAYTYGEDEKAYAVEGRSVLPVKLLPISKGTEIIESISDTDHKILARNKLNKKIDRMVFNLLINACPDENIVTRINSSLQPEDIFCAMPMIEKHNVLPTSIVVNPSIYAYSFRMWGRGFFDEATRREIIAKGTLGRIANCDIWVSTEMPEDRVLVLGQKEFLGNIYQKRILDIKDYLKETSIESYENEEDIAAHLEGLDKQLSKNYVYISTEHQWMAETKINFLLRNPHLVAQVVLK